MQKCGEKRGRPGVTYSSHEWCQVDKEGGGGGGGGGGANKYKHLPN